MTTSSVWWCLLRSPLEPTGGGGSTCTCMSLVSSEIHTHAHTDNVHHTRLYVTPLTAIRELECITQAIFCVYILTFQFLSLISNQVS